MFCNQCGQAIPAGVNFCSSCGAPAHPNVYAASPFTTMYRPRGLRMVGGVCAALYLRFGWDLTATRILTVILALLLFPLTEIAYLVAWLLIPEEVMTIPQASYVPPAGVVPPGDQPRPL